MRSFVVLAGLLLALPATAGEESIMLKEGAGKGVVEANCGGCHSLDYIETNAPFLDQKKWEATVRKMIERFGALLGGGDKNLQPFLEIRLSDVLMEPARTQLHLGATVLICGDGGHHLALGCPHVSHPSPAQERVKPLGSGPLRRVFP